MIETTILNNLVVDEEYCRAVIPFLKEDYFSNAPNKIVYTMIKEFIDKYNSLPTQKILALEAEKLSVSQEQYQEVVEVISEIHPDPLTNRDWLMDETEKHCQDRAILNAIKESINIIDGNSKDKKDKGSIPQILTEALSVSFDSNIGHDFLENFETRYDFYHKTESRIPFDLEMFNKITRGGLVRKSLNVILAGTGVGKTLFMTHCASANLLQGKNVLYITMEMAEEKIAERIDANILNITVDELQELPKESYAKRMNQLKSRVKGKLIIKEYPTSAAGAGHFRHLLQELKLKKNFSPDIIYIDYLNICMSSRLKLGSSINSYLYIKAIAEELRGLAVEFNLPVVTATQTNRDGYSSSDPGLENTSESFGLPATADFMFALVSNDELEALDQLLVIQLKNRYNDPTRDKRFVIGIHRAKMRLYDVENSAQDDIMVDNKYKGGKKKPAEDKPVMDNADFGQRWDEDDSMKFMTKKAGKKDFSGLKIS